MSVARPADARELAGWLATRRGHRVAITGSDDDPSGPARRALETEGVDLVSTAAFDRLVSYQPADLTVTAGAGMSLATLRALLAEEGQRLPPAEGGTVGRWPGTVGGLAAAAPAGAFDLAHGPVRRHLLACRIVSFDGTACRWGRPVMKNVAGYAVHSLCAGSHGRLGVLVETSLRTWPIPAVEAIWSLEPGPTDPAGRAHVSAAPLAQEAPHGAVATTLGLAVELASGPATEGPLPDALAWRWRPDGEPGGRLEARLGGTPEAVSARGRRLRAWVEARGGGARRRPLPDREPEAGGGVPDREQTRRNDPDDARREPRSLDLAVVRFTVPTRDLPGLAARIVEVLDESKPLLEAFPLTGILRCAWRRAPGTAEGEAGVRALLAAAEADGPVATAVERGGPFEHAQASARRDAGAVELEERVVRSLAGGPRAWVADYL